MKRFLTLLFTTVLLTAAMCVTASASDFDAVAEDLSAIGMFRGTGNGYELDRAPTRSEAAIMLVRLYGAEEEAKATYEAGEIKHPFTDVSTFTAPYVAWLYSKGIANGITATTFGSTEKCSAQSYVVFLLRALGYKDGTDFQYTAATTFAKEKGFYDTAMFPGEFLRDDLAALTYQALAADTADGKTYLLDKLVKSGAVDAKAAQPMTEKIEAYRAMAAATENMDSKAMDMDLDVKMDMTMTTDGEALSVPSIIKGNMKTVVDGSGVKMACSTETTAEGETVKVDKWMKDGYVYTSTNMDGEEMKQKYSVGNQLSALEALSIVDVDAMDVSGLAMLESISSKKAGSYTEYTVVIGKGMNSMLNGVMGNPDSKNGSSDMHFGKMNATYTVDGKGSMKKIAMIFTASLEMDMPLEDGKSSSVSVVYDYDMTMTVNATGKDVKISFPDFSGYPEIGSRQIPGTAA